MNNVVVLNLTVGGGANLTIDDGAWSTGLAEADLNAIVSVVGNEIVFNGPFKHLYIRPEVSKEVFVATNGCLAGINRGLRISDVGQELTIEGLRISLAADVLSSIKVSLLATD